MTARSTWEGDSSGKPAAIDIGAGVGGLALGFKRAGFSVAGVERDLEAVEVHRRHVGPCEHADVTGWHPSAPAVVVIGGPPCQPFSVQGRRLGLREVVGPLFPTTAEPRAQLFRHLVRIGVEADARALVLENVRGLLAWDGGSAFREVVREMQRAGFRYVAHHVLNAADFGTPQHRERLFIAAFQSSADAACFEWPKPSHFEDREPRWRTMRAVITGPKEGPLEAAGLLDRPSTTIVAGGGGRVARPGHKKAGDQWAGSVRLSPSQCAALQGFPDGWTWPSALSVAHRGIGNATPPQLSEAVGGAVFVAVVPAMRRVSERRSA